MTWPNDGFESPRIVVLGGVMLDRFVYGRTDRISPEAPVPVLSVTGEIAMLGGARNVARNIASLGGTVALVGICGADVAGETLQTLSPRTAISSPLLHPAPTRPGKNSTSSIRRGF